MRRAALALIPLFVLACDRDPVAPDVAPTVGATSAWQEYAIPVDYELYCPCVDETLRLMGTTYVSQHEVTRPDGSVRLNVRLWVGEDWQLLGSQSGQWVTVPGNHSHYVADLPLSSGVFTVEERFVFRNVVSGVVMDWPSKITVVVNAAGDLKVDRWLLDRCTLRHD